MITLDLMRDMLVRQAEQDPDKVSKCEYATVTEWSAADDEAKAAVPMCIVGCVLVEEFSADPLRLTWETASAMDVLPQVSGQEFTAAALLLAMVVQRLQDGTQGRAGLPWKDAAALGVTAAYTYIKFSPKVIERNDLNYDGARGADLAGQIVQGVYDANGITE